MILRILQIIILCLWISTTFFLVRRSYFPDEARYPEAPIDYVSDLFFDRVSQSDLVVFQRGEKLSHLTVTPKRPQHLHPLLENRRENLREIHFFALARDVTPSSLGQMQLGQLNWSGSLFVDPEFHPEALSLTVRGPRMALNGELFLMLDPPHAKFRVRQGEITLIDSEDMESTKALLETAGALAPQQIPDLSMMEGFEGDQLLQMLNTIQPEIKCQHGQFRILQERYEGYILTISLFEGAALRLYISDLGELLMIDGIPQVEILGEAFAPQDLEE